MPLPVLFHLYFARVYFTSIVVGAQNAQRLRSSTPRGLFFFTKDHFEKQTLAPAFLRTHGSYSYLFTLFLI